MAASWPVPPDLRVRLDDSVRMSDHGRVLVGGSPPRLVRLGERGAVVVAEWLDGAAVGPSEAVQALARRLFDAGLVHPVAPSPPSTLHVHVIVPVRNEPDAVAQAARVADGRPVTIVDDGSATPVPATGEVTVVRRDHSGGPGVARNDGVAALAPEDAEIVAFVDADVETPDGWIDRLLGHFHDPAVAAVAPRVVAADGDRLLDRYETMFPSLDLGPRPGPVGPGRGVPYVPSAALLVRRSAFDDLAGFDPALRFGEDVDLIWRLAVAGHTIRYDPSVTVAHRARAGWGGWLAQRRAYGSSAPALAARHGDAVAPTRAPVGVHAAVAAAVVAPAPVALAIGGVELAAAHRRVRAALGEHHDPALVTGGMRHAFHTTTVALLRAWLPLTLAAVTRRRTRRRVALLLAFAIGDEVRRAPRRIDPARAAVLRLADHATYGVGVWTGLARVGRRGLHAIRPGRTAPGVPSSREDAGTVAG